MNTSIVSISGRGQITIPQEIREQLPVKYFVCHVKSSEIILTPLQTREEFLLELDSAEQDWENQGGATIKDIEKKYKL